MPRYLIKMSFLFSIIYFNFVYNGTFDPYEIRKNHDKKYDTVMNVVMLRCKTNYLFIYFGIIVLIIGYLMKKDIESALSLEIY